MTSKDTWRVDAEKKYVIYRDILKVSEYYRFDPKGEYLHPKLRGDFLVGNEYQPQPLDLNGWIFSPALGLEIGFIGKELRFYDPDTGAVLLSPEENYFALEIERFRADSAERQLEIERELARAEQTRLVEEATAERRRAETAEAEGAQLRAQLAALQQN